MQETLTLAEIETRFDSEWVLIADPQISDEMEILSGRVLWHSKDRDEVDRKMSELAPRSTAVLYTGEMPANVAINL